MDAHDLYGLPLERFVPERGALAKALRAEGRRDEADRVAKLAKPSRAAWAVNQLVRTQRRAVASLFEAGDALQRAQAEVIAGRGDARALRTAAERERASVRQLTEAARGLLSSDGHGLTDATIDRVAETLHAAALDADARERVADGCLERELRHIGLGAAGGLSAPAGGRSRRAARGTTKQAKAAEEAAERPTRERAKAEAERAARERAQRLAAARRAQNEARRDAARATRRLEAAQERHDRAAAALQEAADALAAAREDAERAAAAEQLARAELKRLEP